MGARFPVEGTAVIGLWHKNNTIISVIAWDEDATIWNESTQQPIATFHGHTKRITDCAFVPAKSTLFTASRDNTVKLWDTRDNTKIASIEGHSKGRLLEEVIMGSNKV